jgi:hypothetical protein
MHHQGRSEYGLNLYFIVTVPTGQDRVQFPDSRGSEDDLLFTLSILLISTLKIEAEYSSKTLVSTYKIAQCHNPITTAKPLNLYNILADNFTSFEGEFLNICTFSFLRSECGWTHYVEG